MKRQTKAQAELHPLPSAVVVLTAEQLHAAIRDALADALADAAPRNNTQRVAVTGAELADMLSVSRTTVHRWRHLGMPAMSTGDEFRYNIHAAVAWLEAGGARRAR